MLNYFYALISRLWVLHLVTFLMYSYDFSSIVLKYTFRMLALILSSFIFQPNIKSFHAIAIYLQLQNTITTD